MPAMIKNHPSNGNAKGTSFARIILIYRSNRQLCLSVMSEFLVCSTNPSKMCFLYSNANNKITNPKNIRNFARDGRYNIQSVIIKIPSE